MDTKITIEHVTKRFGDVTIIPDMSLEIEQGEFFTLLGPSGCGKTTLLRMIAGFNTVEAGSIYFNETRANDIPPHKRKIGMVFQNYAIFPHMTVRQNIEYGLKQRKVRKENMTKLVDEIMEVVQITQHAKKSPEKLSGGQQQRVALARAIVIHPSVLLMDEPLSNLDAKLRVEMRSAIRDIQKDVGITTVYVTHDQEEALAVSDRIAVMNKGELEQVATPYELYRNPASLFVATFVGTSDIFDGVLEVKGNSTVITFENYQMALTSSVALQDGMEVKLAIRPEEYMIAKKGEGLHGIVQSVMFLGRHINYHIQLDSSKIIEVSQNSNHIVKLYEAGEDIWLEVENSYMNLFSADGKRNLLKGGVEDVNQDA